MQTIKSFEDTLYDVNDNTFELIAISLFRKQASENKLYHAFLTNLGVEIQAITSSSEIPFLPIGFFKHWDIKTGEWKPESTFLSSGTTQSTPSRHLVKSLDFYLATSARIFESFYGPLTDYVFLALLPSYLERTGSSLIAMVKHFIDQSRSTESGFYLGSEGELVHRLSRLGRSGKKVILWGVSFALLELAEAHELDLSHCIIMETGGMKGRRKEVVREELHAFLCQRFNVSSIHSEYGMTELFSQAYARNAGYFRTPPWMKVMVRSINDPFEEVGAGKTGLLKVMDLANMNTCAFIETEDLGKVRQDGSFEVLGRVDNSDVRGCNLMVE